MDPLLTAANLTLLASYAARDILWLRLLTLVATALLVEVERQGAASHDVLGWYGLFIGINALHTAWLLWERRPVRLSPVEARVHRRAFSTLPLRDFRRLLAEAEWVSAQPGETLLMEGLPLRQLLLIADGRVLVGRDGRAVAVMEAGQFVGEMGFLTGEAPSADVVAMEPVRLLRWRSEGLRSALERTPGLEAAVNGALGIDLARKLAAPRV